MGGSEDMGAAKTWGAPRRRRAWIDGLSDALYRRGATAEDMGARGVQEGRTIYTWDVGARRGHGRARSASFSKGPISVDNPREDMSARIDEDMTPGPPGLKRITPVARKDRLPPRAIWANSPSMKPI